MPQAVKRRGVQTRMFLSLGSSLDHAFRDLRNEPFNWCSNCISTTAFVTNAKVPLAVAFVPMKAVHFPPRETLDAHGGYFEPHWILEFRATDVTRHVTGRAG